MLSIITEIKAYILSQSMLEQVVKNYQSLDGDSYYVAFPITLPNNSEAEQFQLLVTDNQNIQELLDDHFNVLAELLLKIKQHRYSDRSSAAKYKAIVFVTLESLVYRPDRTQIIYYDDAGYGDILDKNELDVYVLIL